MTDEDSRKPLDLTKMSVLEILEAFPGTIARPARPDDQGPRGDRPRGFIIEPGLPLPVELRRAQTRAGTAANEDRGRAHVARARELHASGLSAPVVGIRMAREEGRPDDRPYSERTVRRWLAQAKKG